MKPLWRLARSCGVKPSYLNVKGERVRALPEAVIHAIRSFGIDLQSHTRAEDALRERLARRHERMVEPVTVLWHKETARDHRRHKPAVSLQLLPRRADMMCHCRLVREDGEEHTWGVDLSKIAPIGENGSVIRKPLGISAPLPIGYHRLEIEMDGDVQTAWLFVAPERAAAIKRKGWGAFLPLYAVRSERNWGIGDYTDLQHMSEWIAEHGGSWCATLPLLALSTVRQPYDPSPYTPTSRMFWNEMYVDVEAAPEFEACAEAKSLARSSEFQEALMQLKNEACVQYERVLTMKRRVLERMSQCFFDRGSDDRRKALEDEMRRDPLLLEYARFAASRERRDGARRGEASTDGAARHVNSMDRTVQYHVYAQFLCLEQLSRAAHRANKKGCGLYLDLPVGVDPDGFDAARYHDAFVHDASAGAPPDEFFTLGQNWGILPLHPQRTREDGHAYLRQVIARHLRFASALRIDHVMWMHRTYWAPHDMPASKGVYVQYPADELYAILCIESQRSSAPIIGENLGTVPDAVNRSMERHRIYPLYVAQFAWTGNVRRPLARPSRGAVACLNTHDTPTFAEYWFGGDIARRIALQLLTREQATDEERGREDVRQSVLDFVRRHRVRLRAGGQSDEDVAAIAATLLVELARSDVAMVLVSLEDLVAERKPQNVPGTSDDSNWRRKAACALEMMQHNEMFAKLFRELREVTR